MPGSQGVSAITTRADITAHTNAFHKKKIPKKVNQSIPKENFRTHTQVYDLTTRNKTPVSRLSRIIATFGDVIRIDNRVEEVLVYSIVEMGIGIVVEPARTIVEKLRVVTWSAGA